MTISNKNKINKNKNNILFYAFILISILLIIYLVYKYIYVNNKNKSNFEDSTPAPSENANSKIYGKNGSPPAMGTPQGCSANTDVVDFCINYDNCCSGSAATNNKCFCDNSVTKLCKIQYDACVNDPDSIKLFTKEQLMDKCKLQNSSCCKAYNNISISSNNFSSPKKRVQTDNIICDIKGIKNIEQKCLELCQTNPNCAAYGTTNMTCTLYSQVSPYTDLIDPLTNKPIVKTNINFFEKNV